MIYVPGILFSREYSYEATQLQNILASPLVLKYNIPLEDKWYEGISLLETLPLMEDVYKLEITYENGNLILEENDLAEYWGSSYFLKNKLETDLLFKGELFKNIFKISFSGSPMESRELDIWLSWEGIDEIKEEIGRFSRKHDLTINTIEVPRPESKLIAVVRARGRVPDLVMLQSSAVENLILSRSIQNLNYIKLPDLSNLGKEAFTFENKLWGMPFYFDTQIIFYNKGFISDVPDGEWTLSDMESLSREQLNSDIYPMVWNAYSVNWLIPFQMAFGKERLINSNGEITVNESSDKKALEYIINLKKEKLLIPMERSAMDALFISGKIAMIMSGSYAIPYFESLGLNFGILPFPVNRQTGKNLSPLLDFKAFCMTRRTDSPILARRILQYLSGPGVQQRFCPMMAKLPGSKNILDVPGLEYGHLNILKETVKTGTVIPPKNVYSVYKNNMWKLLRFALNGKMSAEETLNQGQILMENIIQKK